MTPAAQSVFDAAKATRDAFAGVEATHLTKADLRELARAGLSISHNGRDNKRVSARYPASMREADLRARVAAKITERVK
jgi:hypothetical protein